VTAEGIAVDVLGVPITPWTWPELRDRICHWASGPTERRETILYANVHVLNSAVRDPNLTRILRGASTVYCDGSGVRLGAWLLGSSIPTRITGADFIDDLCRALASRGLSLFLLGGSPGVADQARRTLAGRHPDLRFAGTHHGYFTAEDSMRVVEAVNSSRPDVILVGMGTPRQEAWIDANRQHLRVRVVWAVGALLDFVSEKEQRAPNWMTKWHLEWLGRLLANPSRQWRRYVLGNPLFVVRVISRRLRLS